MDFTAPQHKTCSFPSLTDRQRSERIFIPEVIRDLGVAKIWKCQSAVVWYSSPQSLHFQRELCKSVSLLLMLQGKGQ